MLARSILWRIVDLVIGGLFIYAGALKALDPIAFARDIDNYKILPWVVATRLAFYLPWLEILCGLALVSRRLYRGGLSILTALVVIFVVASVVAKARGLDISCGCFGHVTRNFTFTWHLVLDIVILAALGLSFFRSRSMAVAALVLMFATGPAPAAEKDWVTLTDCRYVDAAENDGDSFRVRSSDKEFVARLYYVDAPETNLRQPERTHEQSLHFGISLDETMKIGVKAKERVKELLQKPFVVQTRWATAGGRGREPRYYVIIKTDDKMLCEILIVEGLAQAKGVAAKLPSGEKSKDYMQRLQDMENQAREKRLGAWATSTGLATPSPTENPAPSPSQP